MKLSFNNAVALLHYFEFEEAIPGFQAIERQHPSCSMAAWGIAVSRLARRGAQRCFAERLVRVAACIAASSLTCPSLE
jgi:hypothetical protein